MRFIFNFFFFGILFYLIWMFFPDAFLTLVSWADHVVAFFKGLIISLWDRVQHDLPSHAPPAVPVKEAGAALFTMLSYYFSK